MGSFSCFWLFCEDVLCFALVLSLVIFFKILFYFILWVQYFFLLKVESGVLEDKFYALLPVNDRSDMQSENALELDPDIPPKIKIYYLSWQPWLKSLYVNSSLIKEMFCWTSSKYLGNLIWWSLLCFVLCILHAYYFSIDWLSCILSL